MLVLLEFLNLGEDVYTLYWRGGGRGGGRIRMGWQSEFLDCISLTYCIVYQYLRSVLLSL